MRVSRGHGSVPVCVCVRGVHYRMERYVRAGHADIGVCLSGGVCVCVLQGCVEKVLPQVARLCASLGAYGTICQPSGPGSREELTACVLEGALSPLPKPWDFTKHIQTEPPLCVLHPQILPCPWSLTASPHSRQRYGFKPHPSKSLLCSNPPLAFEAS